MKIIATSEEIAPVMAAAGHVLGIDLSALAGIESKIKVTGSLTIVPEDNTKVAVTIEIDP